MLLVKRICQELKRPVFEVMDFPASELQHWSIFFSIDDNKDRPIFTKKTAETITISESKNAFKELMG